MPEMIETYVALLKMSGENADTHQYFSEIMESFCAKIEKYRSYLAEYAMEIVPLLAYTGVYRKVAREEIPMVERLFSILRTFCYTDLAKEKLEEGRGKFFFQRLMEDERIGETLKRAYDIYFDYNDLEEPIRKYALTDAQLCMIEEREEILKQAEIIRQEYLDYYEQLSDFVGRTIYDGMSEEPYVRSFKKIGRNDPCPCQFREKV